MTINQYNVRQVLSTEDQENVILVVRCYDKTISSIEQAVAYCLEDESALEAVSWIADFGI